MKSPSAVKFVLRTSYGKDLHRQIPFLFKMPWHEMLFTKYSGCVILKLFNVGFGNDDEVHIEDIVGEEFDFAHFQTLIAEGYLVGNYTIDCVWYYLTSKAIDYCPEKNRYIETSKKEKRVVTRRYWLDKVIPFGALIISAIALLNSIFKWWEA